MEGLFGLKSRLRTLLAGWASLPTRFTSHSFHFPLVSLPTRLRRVKLLEGHAGAVCPRVARLRTLCSADGSPMETDTFDWYAEPEGPPQPLEDDEEEDEEEEQIDWDAIGFS